MDLLIDVSQNAWVQGKKCQLTWEVTHFSETNSAIERCCGLRGKKTHGNILLEPSWRCRIFIFEERSQWSRRGPLLRRRQKFGSKLKLLSTRLHIFDSCSSLLTQFSFINAQYVNDTIFITQQGLPGIAKHAIWLSKYSFGQQTVTLIREKLVPGFKHCWKVNLLSQKLL